jgi:hypothetical protein
VEGRVPRGLAKQLALLRWDANSCFLQVAVRNDIEDAEDVDLAKQMGLLYVDRIELAAQEAACNFQFWTGVKPSFELIRESIEEYQAC